MWIFSQYGFFSIVRTSPNEYHVRARYKKDLENLRDSIRLVKEIVVSDDADYRYRLIVGGEVYRTITQFLLDSVDYDNFKAKIAMTEDQMEKMGAYHDVWDRMRRTKEKEGGDSGESSK